MGDKGEALVPAYQNIAQFIDDLFLFAGIFCKGQDLIGAFSDDGSDLGLGKRFIVLAVYIMGICQGSSLGMMSPVYWWGVLVRRDKNRGRRTGQRALTKNS